MLIVNKLRKPFDKFGTKLQTRGMRRVCEVESEGTQAKERVKAEKLVTLSWKTREKKSSIFDVDLVLLLVGIRRCIHRILHTLEVVVHLEEGI